VWLCLSSTISAAELAFGHSQSFVVGAAGSQGLLMQIEYKKGAGVTGTQPSVTQQMSDV
jgi:hypothetical protein